MAKAATTRPTESKVSRQEKEQLLNCFLRTVFLAHSCHCLNLIEGAPFPCFHISSPENGDCELCRALNVIHPFCIVGVVVSINPTLPAEAGQGLRFPESCLHSLSSAPHPELQNVNNFTQILKFSIPIKNVPIFCLLATFLHRCICGIRDILHLCPHHPFSLTTFL